MRALTIAYILLICTVAGFSQTTATYDNVRARQQLTLNGHTLTSVLQTIDSLSTHAQGVTAKAVYDYIATKYSTVSAGTGIDVVKAGSNYTISLDTLKRLHFRTDSTYSGGVGTMRWNLTDGTLDLGLLGGNVTLQLGQESVQRVKHADNSGLTEGKAVYIVGSSGDNLTVRHAQANTESTSANTFGVMTESASGGDKAFCTTFGLVRNINTSNLTEGGMIWLSKDTAGALTAVRPTAPNHGVELGFCVRKHATTGVIFVTIQNGYELRELHDVYAPSPLNNQGLLWKSANSRWEAAAVDTSNTNEGLLTVSGAGAGVTIISNTNNYSSSFSLIDGAGIYINETGNNINIQNTGDLETDNEGKLGVASGGTNSSKLTTNTIPSDSVTIAGGTGITITESPAASGGTITVTNSAPDQTVSLTNGGGVGVTGTYPSFTLTATDQSASNEGTLGVGAGTSTSSVITSNTSGASGVTINASGGISISETTSSNGGSINLSATDQSVSNEGILGVAVNPGADAWLRSNTSTANDIGLVGTNNTTITATASSNGGQIVIDSKAQIDTFSVSGSTLSLSLKNDGEPAKTVTLPGGSPTGSAGGDLSGTYPNPTVARIQGRSVSSTAPSANQVLAWNSGTSAWTPTAVAGTGTVTGTGTATRVAFWDGTSSISSNANLFWDNSNNRLGIGSNAPIDPLSVTGFSGNGIGLYYPGVTTTNGFFKIMNATTANNVCLPLFFAKAFNSLTIGGYSCAFIMDTNEDPSTGAGATTPIAAFMARANNTTVANRPLFDFSNRGPSAASITNGSKVTIWPNGNTEIADGTGSNSGYRLRINANNATQGTFLSGVGTGSTTYSLICTNSGATTATAALAVRDDSKVGIGTNSVDSGATLEVDGTTGGILFPRLTTTQRDALTPTNGLVIYNSTTDKLQVRAGGAWVDLH